MLAARALRHEAWVTHVVEIVVYKRVWAPPSSTVDCHCMLQVFLRNAAGPSLPHKIGEENYGTYCTCPRGGFWLQFQLFYVGGDPWLQIGVGAGAFLMS